MELNHHQEVIATVGIPACGKSSWARKFMECWPNKFVQAERDIIRAQEFTVTGNIWDYNFTSAREKAVSDIQKQVIRDALDDGKSVLITDTNLSERSRGFVQRIAMEWDIEAEFYPMPIELHVAMKRNSKRPDHVPESVMINMQIKMRQYMGEFVQTEAMRAIDFGSKPSCVIMDIDGTLADMKGIRGPFDWDKVDLDKPIPYVAEYAQHIYHDTGHDLILFSGRDGVCRGKTEWWLDDHSIYHNGLFMRPTGSTTNDSVIKETLFHSFVKDRYTVSHIVDDRKQVCVHWESMGFRVMNVGGFTSDF